MAFAAVSSETYYEVLGIRQTASKEEIKNAYKKLALNWYPDKNKNDGTEEKFKFILEAYTCLSERTTREEYDLRLQREEIARYQQRQREETRRRQQQEAEERLREQQQRKRETEQRIREAHVRYIEAEQQRLQEVQQRQREVQERRNQKQTGAHQQGRRRPSPYQIEEAARRERIANRGQLKMQINDGNWKFTLNRETKSFTGQPRR